MSKKSVCSLFFLGRSDDYMIIFSTCLIIMRLCIFFTMLFSYIMHVRIPFWPYIKLMIICCLVMPHFDGSYYVYQHLVHPCLSMVTQVVMNWLFNESKKLSPSRENFLVAADQYIKENGAEALEKLLASKVCHYM